MDSFGKQVADKTYFHVSLADSLDEAARAILDQAIDIVKLASGVDFNVVKLDAAGKLISFLEYSDLNEIAFPTLKRSWSINLESQLVRHRTYSNSYNPPILHRKELLLPAKHPQRTQFEALTKSAEQIGLFDDPHRIGFKQAWEALLTKKGYKVVGHELLPIGNDESDSQVDVDSSFDRVQRHRTALTRYDFSAPMQTLARFGFLDGSKTVFDYGCGRGDDLRNLQANNIQASGWDPHYASDNEKQSEQVVNLGFVINVIESVEERTEALRGAYALADELLVVSAMLSSQESIKGTPYGDGVLTGRNTFQKYYSQDELRSYISEVLQETPIPVGPGIFYVFRDKAAEQRFMYGRLENRRTLLRLSYLSRPTKPTRLDRALAKYEEHRELLEGIWQHCLAFGRVPDISEVDDAEPIKQHFGSLKAAVRFIFSTKESAENYFEEARRGRAEDLTVYFAQLQFQKNKPYRQLETQLQRDVKAFFGDYKSAMQVARDLLFRLADPEIINKACAESATRGIGWYENSDSLQLHTSLVPQLPPELRAYVACGTALYGDVTSADLIKIHIRSGKLTLIKFDDFVGQPLPRMLERTKIKLREQDIDYYVYGEQYEPPFLYNKSRYINEEFPNYADQLAFDEQLQQLSFLDLSGYGPSPSTLLEALEIHRWAIEDLKLTRCRTIPNIDAPCGNNFTYKHLIECGETQAQSGLPNLPVEPATYTALYDLAVNILDPVIDYFGMIKLTYGFCSPELEKLIPARIAPKLDQHAAHEKNKKNKFVCERLGAAVDFIVGHEDMLEVAEWIVSNTTFDRLYFYGADRPIHVSFKLDSKREFIEMLKTPTGKLIPKVRALNYSEVDNLCDKTGSIRKRALSGCHFL